MLVKILRDAFNITKRIRLIDKGYYICFNTVKRRFEVHNKKQKHTFCLVVPFNKLDSRLLQYVRKTRKENFDAILKEIENSNKKLEKESLRAALDKSSFMFGEMFSYASHHEGDVNFLDAYKTKWA